MPTHLMLQKELNIALYTSADTTHLVTSFVRGILFHSLCWNIADTQAKLGEEM